MTISRAKATVSLASLSIPMKFVPELVSWSAAGAVGARERVVRAGASDAGAALTATLRAACEGETDGVFEAADGALEGTAEGALEALDLAACEAATLPTLLGAVLLALDADETTVGAFEDAEDLAMLTTLPDSLFLALIAASRRSGRKTASILFPSRSMMAAL